MYAYITWESQVETKLSFSTLILESSLTLVYFDSDSIMARGVVAIYRVCAISDYIS